MHDRPYIPISPAVVAPVISSLQQTAPTAVTVVWTPPPLSVTGYRVHYRPSSGGGASQTISVDDTATTTTVISGLTNEQSYTVSVEVTSDSTTVIPGVSEEMIVRLGKLEKPSTVFIPSLSLSAPPPDTPEDVGTTVAGESVRLSWESVGNADSYSLTLTQAQGAEQEGLCSDSHTISRSVESTSASISIGIDVGSTETGVLRAYTTYVVTVRAVSGTRGTSRESQRMTVLTPQTSEDPILGNCAL